jgi:hypothetical protein
MNADSEAEGGEEAMSSSENSVTTLRWLARVLFGALVVVMAYGVYNFPAAPIRYAEGRYVDKSGRIHSREDFERLHLWERVFIASWIASAVSAMSYQYTKRRASGL